MHTEVTITVVLDKNDPIAGAYLLHDFMEAAEKSEHDNKIVHSGISTHENINPYPPEVAPESD